MVKQGGGGGELTHCGPSPPPTLVSSSAETDRRARLPILAPSFLGLELFFELLMVSLPPCANRLLQPPNQIEGSSFPDLCGMSVHTRRQRCATCASLHFRAGRTAALAR